MSKPLKISLIVIVSLFALAIIGIFVSNAILTSKLKNYLKSSMPDNVTITYDEIQVSTLSAKLIIKHPIITKVGSTTEKVNAKLEMDTLLVDGFGYWDYIFNHKIKIGSIQFRHPSLTYYHNTSIDSEGYKTLELTEFKEDIFVGRMNMHMGKLEVRDFETDSLMMKAEHLTTNVMDVHLDSATVKQKVPFSFETYNVHFDNFLYQLSAYENVSISSAKITEESAVLRKLKLYTKYSKPTLSKMISVERDHFDVKMDSLVLQQHDLGYKNDSLFYFNIPQVVFYKPNMQIYRNKLIADDLSIKPMYGKMLRNLNFDLTIPEVLLKDATIVYSELVNPDTPSGTISFKQLNATIKNVSNTYEAPKKTTLDIEAIFMKTTPIKVEWYFDAQNVNDHFVFKADVGRLPAEDLNLFSKPNLNVQFEGELTKTYFTIDGNFQDSNVKLRTNYDNFKVNILEKNRKDKNKIVSAIANLFIKKHSENEPDNFRVGEKSVERDKTKSVFNFLWLNARSGLMSALTGNGKEKD